MYFFKWKKNRVKLFYKGPGRVFLHVCCLGSFTLTSPSLTSLNHEFPLINQSQRHKGNCIISTLNSQRNYGFHRERFITCGTMSSSGSSFSLSYLTTYFFNVFPLILILKDLQSGILLVMNNWLFCIWRMKRAGNIQEMVLLTLKEGLFSSSILEIGKLAHLF